MSVGLSPQPSASQVRIPLSPEYLSQQNRFSQNGALPNFGGDLPDVPQEKEEETNPKRVSKGHILSDVVGCLGVPAAAGGPPVLADPAPCGRERGLTESGPGKPFGSPHALGLRSPERSFSRSEITYTVNGCSSKNNQLGLRRV